MTIKQKFLNDPQSMIDSGELFEFEGIEGKVRLINGWAAGLEWYEFEFVSGEFLGLKIWCQRTTDGLQYLTDAKDDGFRFNMSQDDPEEIDEEESIVEGGGHHAEWNERMFEFKENEMKLYLVFNETADMRKAMDVLSDHTQPEASGSREIRLIEPYNLDKLFEALSEADLEFVVEERKDAAGLLYVEEPDGEVYEGHLEHAVARTSSRLGLSDEEARTKLLAATIDKPLEVEGVKYWTETDRGEMMPQNVSKAELSGIEMVGPIAEGETPLEAIRRMERLFGKTCKRYAFEMHDKPMIGGNQQFPVIIGTVWSGQ